MSGRDTIWHNSGGDATLRRFKAHNPGNELLIGRVLEGERITDRKVKSNKREQTVLF